MGSRFVIVCAGLVNSASWVAIAFNRNVILLVIICSFGLGLAVGTSYLAVTVIVSQYFDKVC